MSPMHCDEKEWGVLWFQPQTPSKAVSTPCATGKTSLVWRYKPSRYVYHCCIRLTAWTIKRTVFNLTTLTRRFTQTSSWHVNVHPTGPKNVFSRCILLSQAARSASTSLRQQSALHIEWISASSKEHIPGHLPMIDAPFSYQRPGDPGDGRWEPLPPTTSSPGQRRCPAVSTITRAVAGGCRAALNSAGRSVRARGPTS